MQHLGVSQNRFTLIAINLKNLQNYTYYLKLTKMELYNTELTISQVKDILPKLIAPSCLKYFVIRRIF